MSDRVSVPPQPVRYDQTRTADVGIGALDELLATLPQLTFEAGSLLLKQGDQSDYALYLTEGTVAVFAESDYERVQLASFEAPRLIGELGLLAGFKRTATIEALTTVHACRLEATQLREIGAREPDFLLSLIAQLGRQLDGTNRALSLYGNALSALERREFDPRILDELSNPSPQLVTFSNAFRRFADQIIDKRQQADELASAAVIQRSFLPRQEILSAVSDRLELSAEMRPARDVAGDLYDFFVLDKNHVAFAIGDVCGKGMPASLFMAVTMTTLRSAARSEDDVASTLAEVNAFLSKDNDASMFATLFYGVLNLKTGRLRYGNCGHNAPYIIGPSGMRSLETTGIPIGLMADRAPSAAKTTLEPGEMLVLFTDGVTEAMNPRLEEFGGDRLEALLKGATNLAPAGLLGEIFRWVDVFADGADQADDITCLVVRRPD